MGQKLNYLKARATIARRSSERAEARFPGHYWRHEHARAAQNVRQYRDAMKEVSR